MSSKYNAYRNNHRKHIQYKLNSLPWSTFLSPKITGDVRKNCTEVVPAMQANITIIPPQLRGDMYPQEHGPDFPFSLNALPACAACSVWYQFDSPRGCEEEEIQRGTNAYLQTRLQLVTGNVKKIWRYHSKIQSSGP